MANTAGRMKCAIFSLYTLLIVCMGSATIVEKVHGSESAHSAIYGTWWFIGMWAALSLLSLAYLVKRKLHKRIAVAFLHFSFVVILSGALVTHITSKEGQVHLRKGVPVSSFTDSGNEESPFPFSLLLTEFDVMYYPGTDAIMDYQANITVDKEGTEESIRVSMNNIGKVAGYRLYQSSYDSDHQGVILLVARDPYGIAITYMGYIMLFVSVLWTLVTRYTHIRQLYRTAFSPALALLIVPFLHSFEVQAQEPGRLVGKEIAHEAGSVPVLYNGRICPLNTAATEFVTKLCGKSTWKGYSADEIFLGWMIYYSEWEAQPIIKVKSREVQQLLGIRGKWASLKDFYTSQHDYKLKDKANDSSLSNNTRQAVHEADEKIQMIAMFYNSEMLRMFPLDTDGKLTWHTPGSTDLPQDIGEAEFQFIHHAMDNLVKHILVEDVLGAKRVISRIKLYQKEKAADALPSRAVIKAEIFYNSLRAKHWVVGLFLTLSMLFCLFSLAGKNNRWFDALHRVFIAHFAGYLSVLLVLRWWISGHVPLSNGFETMLFMAWVTVVLSIAMMRRLPLLKSFGPVASSLCLLVSVIAMGNPQVTHLVPVLQSPLLSVHVAVIIIAYTLFAFVAFIAIHCLFLGNENKRMRLTALSRLMLYPAVALLSIGIFTGAVWANVSWGTYWSWDPKETWALIMLMVYAVPLHQSSVTCLNSPRRYHIYILASFLAVIMTYFGVNYFMSGMHSYV